jgi:hypothetical protein
MVKLGYVRVGSEGIVLVLQWRLFRVGLGEIKIGWISFP